MKNILIVDDSALMRRVLSDIINSDEELHNDKYAANGVEALEMLDAGMKFDTIILDINMPKMNGIEFLRALNRKRRNEKVIIVSTIAREGTKETIEALELGAFDFVTKPDSLSEARGIGFSRKLIDLIRSACNMDVPDLEKIDIATKEDSKVQNTYKNAGRSDKSKHSVKALGAGSSKLVALACSTGGPKALQYVIPFLPANLDAPVLLVQHMPEGFTASLSKRLDELSRINVKEAADGDILQKGTVYIAKGGSQMRLHEKGKNSYYISETIEPARNGLKPCADIMYESLMNTSFDEITCVIMTGMGSDGTQGILQLEKTNKIYVIGQDAESSIVYGMPKAIAEAGAVDEVVSLKRIADAITKHVGVR